ncbi:unnamed protein product [Gemmataceae bacterium]|nr:unnamed protein product [Gemmataceae bacterium]VTU02516.1 unnamed protein product [Gemmataceae bacterium]
MCRDSSRLRWYRRNRRTNRAKNSWARCANPFRVANPRSAWCSSRMVGNRLPARSPTTRVIVSAPANRASSARSVWVPRWLAYQARTAAARAAVKS